MLKRSIERGLGAFTWKTGQDVFDWWISGKGVTKKDQNIIDLTDIDEDV